MMKKRGTGVEDLMKFVATKNGWLVAHMTRIKDDRWMKKILVADSRPT